MTGREPPAKPRRRLHRQAAQDPQQASPHTNSYAKPGLRASHSKPAHSSKRRDKTASGAWLWQPRIAGSRDLSRLVLACRPNELSSLQDGLDVRRRRARIAWRGEVGSVVGEDDMDLVGDGGGQAAQEVPRGAPRHLLVHRDEGELRRSVDGEDEVELALRRSNLGDVDRKLADWIGLEFAFGGGFAFDLRQPGDLVALQTRVKGRARPDAGS
jgi:hypothetical protein